MTSIVSEEIQKEKAIRNNLENTATVLSKKHVKIIEVMECMLQDLSKQSYKYVVKKWSDKTGLCGRTVISSH